MPRKRRRPTRPATPVLCKANKRGLGEDGQQQLLSPITARSFSSLFIVIVMRPYPTPLRPLWSVQHENGDGTSPEYMTSASKYPVLLLRSSLKVGALFVLQKTKLK